MNRYDIAIGKKPKTEKITTPIVPNIESNNRNSDQYMTPMIYGHNSTNSERSSFSDDVFYLRDSSRAFL
jgi:hypothetical protein